MPDAVIFDLYGTLLHLEHDSRPFMRVTGSSKLEIRRLLKIALTTSNATLADFLRNNGVAPPDNLSDLEAQLEGDVASAQLYQDSLATLTNLRERGILVGVISNLADM